MHEKPDGAVLASPPDNPQDRQAPWQAPAAGAIAAG